MFLFPYLSELDFSNSPVWNIEFDELDFFPVWNQLMFFNPISFWECQNFFDWTKNNFLLLNFTLSKSIENSEVLVISCPTCPNLRFCCIKKSPLQDFIRRTFVWVRNAVMIFKQAKLLPKWTFEQFSVMTSRLAFLDVDKLMWYWW